MKFKLTDETIDSYGEIILADGVDTDRFLNNPVMFNQHQSWSWSGEASAIIGKWINLTKKDKALFAEPVFANTPKAKEIESLVNDGFLQAVSVGIRVKEWQPGKGTNPDVISKCELLEVSFVNIPANPNAVVQKSGEKAEVEGVDIPKTAKEAFETQKTYYKSFQTQSPMEGKEKVKDTQEKKFFETVKTFFSGTNEKSANTLEERIKALENDKAKIKVVTIGNPSIASIENEKEVNSEAYKAIQTQLYTEKEVHNATKTALELMTVEKDKFKKLSEKFGAKAGEEHTSVTRDGDDDFEDNEQEDELIHNKWVYSELSKY